MVTLRTNLGFDNVANLGEETENPNRDLPIGIIGSITISGMHHTTFRCAMASHLMTCNKTFVVLTLFPFLFTYPGSRILHCSVSRYQRNGSLLPN